jgi:translocation and assembly module TamB
VGQVRGDIRIENNTLWVERLLATSSLLYVDGHGSLSLDDAYDANMHWDFIQSSIDPYLKFVAPEFSPYARAIVSGAVDVRGPLRRPEALAIDASIDDATLTLFDYELKNDGRVQMQFRDNVFRIGDLRLRGADTNLELSGSADAGRRTWDLAAAGDASLSILQLFRLPITASGAAELDARLRGSFDEPLLSGSATVVGGRLRPLSSPHSLEALNGRITFDGTAINLDGLTGRIGNGDVTFGGSIALSHYTISEFAVTASGRSMRLRYPTGFNSTVDMDLLLGGSMTSPRLSGTVDVLKVAFVGQSQSEGLLGFAAAGSAPAAAPLGPVSSSVTSPEGLALGLDIQVTVPSTTLIDNRTVRVFGRADLHVGGTFDHPLITGSLDILSGEMQFLGNRYFLREGAIDFSGDAEPIFDVTLETRPRVASELFDVTIQISGPLDFNSPLGRLHVTFNSDPPLSETDVASLLFGGTPDYRNAEQRALRSPQESQQQMLQTMGAVLLTSPISSRIGSVVERTLPVDTVSITPLLTNEVSFQQLNPSARVTLGTRISPRVYLTYSRTLNTATVASEEIILLEYDESDRISWVLSRNADRSFALDFRIRYVF